MFFFFNGNGGLVKIKVLEFKICTSGTGLSPPPIVVYCRYIFNTKNLPYNSNIVHELRVLIELTESKNRYYT